MTKETQRRRRGLGRLSLAERLDRHSMPITECGCQMWIGATSAGYGQIRIGGKNKMAHRVAYELFCEPIPDGMQIDHLCKVTSCINPDHLEVVTASENTKRGDLWQRHITHCRRGHAYTPDNLAPRFLSKGQRVCLRCQRERKYG